MLIFSKKKNQINPGDKMSTFECTQYFFCDIITKHYSYTILRSNMAHAKQCLHCFWE